MLIVLSSSVLWRDFYQDSDLLNFSEFYFISLCRLLQNVWSDLSQTWCCWWSGWSCICCCSFNYLLLQNFLLNLFQNWQIVSSMKRFSHNLHLVNFSELRKNPWLICTWTDCFLCLASGRSAVWPLISDTDSQLPPLPLMLCFVNGHAQLLASRGSQPIAWRGHLSIILIPNGHILK